MTHRVRILNMARLNHDVIQFRLEKPSGYHFVAGQATELSLEAPQKKGPNPFTFTALNTAPYLELTIKIYEAHQGLTADLSRLTPGDHVLITDPWDSFINKGPGVFIAGGAGITPFIAILRQMHVEGKVGESRLFFSNKTSADIFLRDELKTILGDRYIDILTRDEGSLSPHHIDEAFIKNNIKAITQPFYVCGPPGFVDTIQQLLIKIGAAENTVNISL
jgi:ferredoxin-NADP reductase